MSDAGDDTIAEAFDSFEAMVLHGQADPQQVERTRMVFYCGAAWMLRKMGDLMGLEDHDLAEARLDALVKEADAFDQALKARVDALQTAKAAEAAQSFTVRAPQLEHTLRALARHIQAEIPEGFGFTLLLCSFGKTGLLKEGPHGSMFYISNGQREDMLLAMKEFIRRNTQ